MATHIQPMTRPVLFAVTYQGEAFASGILEVGGALGTPQTLIQSEDENTFLAAAQGKAASYKPLPGTGAWLEAGEIYGYKVGLVIVRQSHNRTIYAPEETPALFSVYRAGASGALEWVANEKIYLGTRRTYGGKTYEAIQAHTTQPDWTPDRTPALWKEVTETPTPGAWAVGVAYKAGDRVTYQGKSYQCLQAHTSQAGWTPPAVPALWKVIA